MPSVEMEANMNDGPLGAAIQERVQKAVESHLAGEFQNAERGYLAVLQGDSNNAVANHNIGILFVQTNRAQASLPYFEKALEVDPAQGQYWLNYIDALFKAGRVEDARQMLAQARQQGLQGVGVEELTRRLGDGEVMSSGLRAAPSHGDIDALVALFGQGRLDEAHRLALAMTDEFPMHEFGWKALGAVCKQQGKNEEALLPMKKSALLSPTDVEAHYNLAVVLQDMDRLEEAEAAYKQALKLDANYADALGNLGVVLHKLGQFEQAAASFRHALAIRPDNVAMHYNLGRALLELKNYEMAEYSFRRAVEYKPDYAEAYFDLGLTLKELGRLEDACDAYRHALRPDNARVYYNLGNALSELARFEEAEACYRQSLQIQPDFALAHYNLGCLFFDTSRFDMAEASLKSALEVHPDYFEAYNNLLYTYALMPDCSPASYLELARQFGRRVQAHVHAPFNGWICEMQPMRLRVGFVSGDFYGHPVGYFLESVLDCLSYGALELIAYPTSGREDELTERIKSRCSAWRPLVGLKDETAARLIHEDGIHVLIDLSGHTRDTRLPVFAWKPAPIQVSWLGYFATTGVEQMDYFIADPWTLPESEEASFTEKIWRLPETRLCFSPPVLDVAVSELPVITNGYVTFGCFNNLTKINDDVVALWSRVLKEVPESRIFLKAKQLADESSRQKVLERFAWHNIDASRIVMEGFESRKQYMEAYHRVDVALDPFPFPGGTTTVEGLWMGVPVLTLAGERFLSRQGVGLLMNAGLADWVAVDEDDYVARIVKHTNDLQSLSELRLHLREKLLSSPVMNAARFARHFEAALWEMWRQWCADR